MKRLIFIFLVLMFISACTGMEPRLKPVQTTRIEATATESVTIAETSTSKPSPTTTAKVSTPSQAIMPICPDLPRPAILSLTPNVEDSETTTYTAWHQETDTRCNIDLPFENMIITDVISDTIYITQFSEHFEQQLIHYHRDGTPHYLDLPTRDYQAVLPDTTGQYIAWMQLTSDAQTEVITSTLYATDLRSDQTKELVSISNQTEVNHGSPFRAWFVRPVRFVDNALLYTIDPDGKGGSWGAYSGKYSNLWRVSLTGSDTENIYQCPATDTSDCINDISPDNQQLAISNREENNISIVSLDGSIKHTFSGPGEEYIGQALFSETGQHLVFLSANIRADFFGPEQSWVSFVDVANNGEPILVTEGLISIRGWVSENQIIIKLLNDDIMQLVDLQGNIVSVPKDLWPPDSYRIRILQ